MLAAPAALLAAVAAAAPAQAEEVWTTQAATARTEATMWAGAGDPPGGVCLVDTGVDENPDTLAVVERLAMDGGAGADVSQGKHGTLMVMIAAGGHNGWGMVGAAPAVRIVSVRAWRPGESSFNFNDVRRAIWSCIDLAPSRNLHVINLSLGSRHEPDLATQELMEEAIDRARLSGLNVVAAAGNSPGQPDSPASYAPVLAVGAADREGALCTWAASGADLVLRGVPSMSAFRTPARRPGRTDRARRRRSRALSWPSCADCVPICPCRLRRHCSWRTRGGRSAVAPSTRRPHSGRRV